jgi:hypothetical protein
MVFMGSGSLGVCRNAFIPKASAASGFGFFASQPSAAAPSQNARLGGCRVHYARSARLVARGILPAANYFKISTTLEWSSVHSEMAGFGGSGASFTLAMASSSTIALFLVTRIQVVR